MTGQHLTALSLLYLSELTQRVAIIPSWRDQDHYGDAMIKMSDLFDLEKYRRISGALFVECVKRLHLILGEKSLIFRWSFCA